MQAFRRACPRRIIANAPRCYATATANPIHVVSHTSTSSQAAVPLSNVEAQWEKLTADEQLAVHQQLEELQKKDWKELSIDEKKAGTLRLLDVLSTSAHEKTIHVDEPSYHHPAHWTTYFSTNI
jgi:hypothetical protein